MLGYGEVAPVYPYELPRALAAHGYATAVIGQREREREREKKVCVCVCVDRDTNSRTILAAHTHLHTLSLTLSPSHTRSHSLTLSYTLSHSTTTGKDHFGWNTTTNSGISHGFEHVALYDGLGSGLPSDFDTEGYDNYDQWFQKQRPGSDPMATGLGWNTWRGREYVYPEFLHPTGLSVYVSG